MALENEVSRILYGQRKNGFLFDHISAEILKARLEEKMENIKREVQTIFKPRVSEVKLYAQFTKTGTLAKIAKTLEDKGVRLTDEEYQELSGFTHRPISRYMIAEFNLSSRPQISERLQELGWKPDNFTPNGRPTVDEQVLLGIKEIPVAGLIAEYMLLQKRVAQIGGKKGWLEYVQDDGRVHGSVISNGTITGRMTHQQPNMAQVPSVSSHYGKECRSCWINQEIRRRHSYMRSSTEQEIENSERWLVEAQAVGKNLGNISLIISHHLDLFEKECQQHRNEAFSKD